MSGGKSSEQRDGPRIWFDSGRWWFRGARSAGVRDVSGEIRRSRYLASELAAALGMGDRSFRRMVVSSLGIPPGQWLRFERAVAARHLLREGRPVKEVSIELGFSHQSEFGKEFRRWYNTSPSDFRRLVG